MRKALDNRPSTAIEEAMLSTWSWARVLLLSIVWVAVAGYLSLRLSRGYMQASGPSGGLVGIAASPALLLRAFALCLVPPALLIWAWRRARG